MVWVAVEDGVVDGVLDVADALGEGVGGGVEGGGECRVLFVGGVVDEVAPRFESGEDGFARGDECGELVELRGGA